MNGISMITAMTIYHRGVDIVCDVAGPAKNGKYAGWIILHRDGEYDHDLLSTEPVFETAEAAKTHMENVVKAVRALPAEQMTFEAIMAPRPAEEKPE